MRYVEGVRGDVMDAVADSFVRSMSGHSEGLVNRVNHFEDYVEGEGLRREWDAKYYKNALLGPKIEIVRFPKCGRCSITTSYKPFGSTELHLSRPDLGPPRSAFLKAIS